MAKAKTKARRSAAQGRQTLAELKKKKDRLEDDISWEDIRQELNPEDHPVRFATSEKEIKESKERQKKMRLQIKSINRMIAKMKGRGGGGGGSIKSPDETARSRMSLLKKKQI